jgi:hypothetical protein
VINSLPIIVYLAAAFVLTRVPYIGAYLSLCPTLLHGVFRFFIGGEKNKRIRLVKNDSALETTNDLTFKHSLIDYISYTGTILVAIGLFYLASFENYHLILSIFIGLIIVSLICWIRHFVEFLWALSFAALLGVPIYFGYNMTIMHIAVFLASYLLVQSVLSALHVCRQSFFNRKGVGIVAKVKWIPSMMLGIALLGQSLYASFFIMNNFSLHIGVPWGNIELMQLPWI